MAVQEIFNSYIRPVQIGEQVGKVLQVMENLHCPALPCIAENNLYVGLVHENSLLDSYTDVITLDFPFEKNDTFIYQNQHWLEAMPLFNENKPIVAVLNKEGMYQGCFTTQDVVFQIGRSYAFQEVGSILILSVNQFDYSLSEIARLVESNNAKILYLTTYTLPNEPLRLYIILKINQNDLTRIAATFERFSYDVVAKFHQQPVFADVDQERLGLLWKYLNL